MKLKILILILVIVILIGVNYAQAQKSESSTTTVIRNDIEEKNNVYLNDPLADQPYTAVSRDSFEESWIQMGKQAISYQ